MDTYVVRNNGKLRKPTVHLAWPRTRDRGRRRSAVW